MSMDISQIGKQVRDARQAAGLSQDKIAEAANTSRVSLSRIENGQANPTINHLTRIANAMGYELRVRLEKAPVKSRLEELAEGLLFLSETDSPVRVLSDSEAKQWQRIMGQRGEDVSHYLRNHTNSEDDSYSARWLALQEYFTKTLAASAVLRLKQIMGNPFTVIIVGFNQETGQAEGVYFEVVET